MVAAGAEDTTRAPGWIPGRQWAPDHGQSLDRVPVSVRKDSWNQLSSFYKADVGTTGNSGRGGGRVS